MQNSLKGVLFFMAAGALMLPASHARAFEYPLSFTPVGDYEGLAVAGYEIVGKTVIGNCSYTAIRSGSGRDPRPSYIPMPGTCTWNLYGALLNYVEGTAPAAPTPVATQGTETIYARKSRNIYTGTDSALSGRGFVFDRGSHYNWLTSNAYLVLPQQPYSFTVTLTSNGDIPLDVRSVKATTSLAATSVVIDSTTCSGLIAVGATCDVSLTYNDSKLSSPSGLAYDGVTVHLASNAGVTDDFVQRYTDEVAVPVDDGGP